MAALLSSGSSVFELVRSGDSDSRGLEQGLAAASCSRLGGPRSQNLLCFSNSDAPTTLTRSTWTRTSATGAFSTLVDCTLAAADAANVSEGLSACTNLLWPMPNHYYAAKVCNLCADRITMFGAGLAEPRPHASDMNTDHSSPNMHAGRIKTDAD